MFEQTTMLQLLLVISGYLVNHNHHILNRNIYNNSITSLPSDLFTYTTELSILFVAQFSLLFSFCIHFILFNVSTFRNAFANSITVLPSGIFQHNTNLSQVYVAHLSPLLKTLFSHSASFSKTSSRRFQLICSRMHRRWTLCMLSNS